jgi:hypothetical protein
MVVSKIGIPLQFTYEDGSQHSVFGKYKKFLVAKEILSSTVCGKYDFIVADFYRIINIIAYYRLNNGYITYLLTPWSRVPLEKLTSLCS